MPREDNSKNPLQFEIKATEPTKAFLRKQVSSVRYFTRLLTAVNQRLNQGYAEELPARWDVRCSWRNPNTKHGLTKRWRDDDFVSALNESREGFALIVGQFLGRFLSREKAKAEIRKHQSRKKKKPSKRGAR